MDEQTKQYIDKAIKQLQETLERDKYDQWKYLNDLKKLVST